MPRTLTLLLDSSRGLPPHLTLDMLDLISRDAAAHRASLQIHLDQLFDMPIFSKDAVDRAIFDNSAQTVALTLSNVLKLPGFVLWLGCQPESLLASSVARACGGDDERVCLTIATEAGNRLVSDIELADYVRRLLPNIMLAPVDPSLLSAYAGREPQSPSLALSTGHMHPSYESLDNFDQSPLASPACTSPFISLLLTDMESSSQTSVDRASPFLTASSRLKYIKRWTTCFGRTFKMLDTLIAHCPKETGLFASISTEFVRHDHLFPQEQFSSRLAAAVSDRAAHLQGLVLQCESSTDFEMQKSLLSTLVDKVAPKGLPLCLRLAASHADNFSYFDSLAQQHQISVLDARFVSRLSNRGEALALTAKGRLESIDLHSALYRKDSEPLQPGCSCFSCKGHRRAYIHHLLNTKEMLAPTLLSVHNIHTALGHFSRISQMREKAG